MPIHNPNCDGSHCRSESGEVRLLPYGGGGNLILCQSCYAHEIRYRKERNKELSDPFDLPEWVTLERYPE